MIFKSVVLCLVLMATAATGAAAQPVVALHAVPRAGNPGTCDGLTGISCAGYSVEVPDAEDGAFVYLVIARGDPEAGVSGISYAFDISTLAAVEDFILCADSRIGSQSGAVISWDPGASCQRSVIGQDGVHAVAGVFVVGTVGPSFMGIFPNQETEPKTLAVIGCDGSSVEATGAGFVTFGPLTDDGFNPCASMVPTRATTWGRMKSFFGS